MARYRWSYPLEWLREHLDGLHTQDGELLSEAKELASQLDSDQIQDIYETDMDKDGYFTDLDAPDPDAEEDEETKTWTTATD
uniref:Uncharacterized protein n=1 Tax=viral metagenome TaxID=1070528 RepID=A0A6M3L1E3_9ZZZZ